MFSVSYENYEAFDSRDAFSVRAYLADVHFVFFAYGYWAVSSPAFIFGVSWASLSRTYPTFSPLLDTLTVIYSVSRSLSFTYKIGYNACAIRMDGSVILTFHFLALIVVERSCKRTGFC